MEKIVISEEESKNFITELFQKAGVSKEQGEIVADHLTMAEMRGQASHGLNRIPFYLEKLEGGGYQAAPNMRIVKETKSTILLDGDHGIGIISAVAAMKKSMKKAKQTGCGITAVKNCNHIGFLAYYTMMAAREGMIGGAICNAGASTAVFGTYQAVLGTNPFSVALPADKKAMVVLDCATSIVAQGKVAIANRENKKIPKTWAYDKDGNITDSPKEALEGSMRPFGDYKGSGLGMIISMLTSGLTGMPFDMEKENLERISDSSAGSALAAQFWAVDISAFTDLESFKSRIDDFIGYVKHCNPFPGIQEIFIPGEKEFYEEKRNREKNGFEIGRGLYRKLSEIASKYGLNYDMKNWLKAEEGVNGKNIGFSKSF